MDPNLSGFPIPNNFALSSQQIPQQQMPQQQMPQQQMPLLSS
jgi:hypothetical protein